MCHMPRLLTAIAMSGLGVAAGLYSLGVAPAFLTSPPAQGCNECPRNLVLIADRGTLADDLRRAGVDLGLAWALGLALLVLVRLVRATDTGRRAHWPVLVTGIAYLALVGATFAASLERGFVWNGTLERRLWLGEAAALVGIAAGVSWSRLRSRRARSTVARLIVDLAKAPPPGGLRDVVAA